MASQFSYFVTSGDLAAIVRHLEDSASLQYIEYKNFTADEYAHALKYHSLLTYPHLGHARSGQCRGDMFLVLPRMLELRPKCISTEHGERVIVSQELNVPSVVWALGGHKDESLLLRGEVSTIYSDSTSKQIMSKIRKSFSKYCRKQDGYYISPGVFGLHDVRLITISEGENKDVDYKLLTANAGG